MVIELKTKQGNKINMEYNGGFVGVNWYQGKFYAPIGGKMIEVSRENDVINYGKVFTHAEFDTLIGVVKLN